jgi:hypothetical protein
MTRDENIDARDLAIIEKYEVALNYIYPKIQAGPRKHGTLRDHLIGLLLEQVRLLYQAAKSKQPSRLYEADAHLATLRFSLRFAARPDIRIITPHQLATVFRPLAETGAMLGQWVKTAKQSGRSGQ